MDESGGEQEGVPIDVVAIAHELVDDIIFFASRLYRIREYSAIFLQSLVKMRNQYRLYRPVPELLRMLRLKSWRAHAVSGEWSASAMGAAELERTMMMALRTWRRWRLYNWPGPLRVLRRAALTTTVSHLLVLLRAIRLLQAAFRAARISYRKSARFQGRLISVTELQFAWRQSAHMTAYRARKMRRCALKLQQYARPYLARKLRAREDRALGVIRHGVHLWHMRLIARCEARFLPLVELIISLQGMWRRWIRRRRLNVLRATFAPALHYVRTDRAARLSMNRAASVAIGCLLRASATKLPAIVPAEGAEYGCLVYDPGTEAIYGATVRRCFEGLSVHVDWISPMEAVLVSRSGDDGLVKEDDNDESDDNVSRECGPSSSTALAYPEDEVTFRNVVGREHLRLFVKLDDVLDKKETTTFPIQDQSHQQVQHDPPRRREQHLRLSCRIETLAGSFVFTRLLLRRRRLRRVISNLKAARGRYVAAMLTSCSCDEVDGTNDDGVAGLLQRAE